MKFEELIEKVRQIEELEFARHATEEPSEEAKEVVDLMVTMANKLEQTKARLMEGATQEAILKELYDFKKGGDSSEKIKTI